jgi:hypothetical protein
MAVLVYRSRALTPAAAQLSVDLMKRFATPRR